KESIINITINKTITIDLEYKDGSVYDIDNDGIESTTGIVDLTVENTGFNWEVDEENLCTRWETYSIESEESTIVCYGSGRCCQFVDLLATKPVWDELFYSSYGTYGAEFNNIISAQVLHVDYNLSITDPYAEIYYSSWDNLSTYYYLEYVDFQNVCTETCLLTGFNKTSYKLIFEIEDAVLELDTLTFTIIDDLGLIDVGGIPKFQDAAFKVILPTKKMGTFSFFGLGGLSSFVFEDITPALWDTPGDRGMLVDISEDFEKRNHLLNTGVNHTISINDNSFIKTSVSYSSEGIEDNIYETKIIKTDNGQGGISIDTVGRTLNFKSRLKKSTYRGALSYRNKINAKNKIEIGTKYSLFDYANDQSRLQDDLSTRVTLVDFKENVGTVSNYISWKHRLNENITIVSGFHNMNVLFNNKSTLEPRLAVRWKLNNTNSVNAGYGNHSNMESIHNYFVKVQLEDESEVEPNIDLDLLKAHHYIVGYEKRFTKNLRAKVEVYYQDLYNLPVENNDTSYYATINEGLDLKYVDLVNKGTGKNYGVELTLERFFNNNYYFLINGSLYNSKYRSLDGVDRNTQYNGNYLLNILCGKEFEDLGKKKNQTLGLNAKVFYGGGKKIIPLLRNEQGNLAVDPTNGRYWDYKKAYEDKIEDLYQITVSASYKWNKPKATHELFVNLDNVTNTKGKIDEYYDESEPNSIGHLTQFGFFPNLMYRVYF
ncbi:MAG: TonB-dependent receptor, partial [Bacteroidetes bacterium]|nr:TonB-dependent receptor [Bacteroidota bacterium]